MKHNIPTIRSRNEGFTLLEVLMAMGVFAIGFVFIAAIFPVAALLQKEAVDTVNAQQVGRNTKAIMGAMTVTTGDIISSNMTSATYDVQKDQTVHAFNSTWLDSQWPINVRSSPTTIANPDDRKFFWVPLVRDTNSATGITNNEVYFYVFVLLKHNSVTYLYPPSSSVLSVNDCANSYDSTSIPKVFAVGVSAISTNTLKFTNTYFNGNPSTYDSPTQLDIGDKFLDNNGTIYTVADYDMSNNTITVDGILLPTPNTISQIWFASPGEDGSGNPSGKNSPTMDILILTDVVQP
jgi:prepilin-type N-terminal cleavage/methylation domain-containing protein